MASTTTRGYPYPDSTDPADVPADVQLLAEAIDAAPGIAALTQAQIDALTVAEKWAGRIVWNQTASRLQRCDGSTWSNLVLPDSTDTLTNKSLTSPTVTGTPSLTGTFSTSGSGKFEGLGAITICTSGTRPGSPSAGQVIFETDTSLFYGWNGAAWAPIGGSGGGDFSTFLLMGA